MERDTEIKMNLKFTFFMKQHTNCEEPLNVHTYCLFYWTCVKHALIAGVVKPWQIERSQQESGPCSILNVEE